MKLYLDNSFLNRPFDDSSIPQNRMEADVLVKIIEDAKSGTIQMCDSAVIRYENSLNPHSDRKKFVDGVLKFASHFQRFTGQVKQVAREHEERFGLSPYDARHIASAEVAGVDFFVTCDYAVIKKYKGSMKAVSPLEFFRKYESNNAQR